MNQTTNNFRKLAIAALFATAPSVLAQSYLPPVSVPAPGNTPDKYRHCDQAYRGKFDSETFATCEDGQEEARKIAERFAGNNGKLHGYLEGFSYAVFQATDANSDDGAEVARGRAALNANGSDMQAGLQAGISKGQKEGGADGNNGAQKVWDAAFRKGELPQGSSSSHYQLKVPTYTPDFTDPYDRFVGRKTVESIMRNDIDAKLRTVAIDIQNSDLIFVTQPVYSLWDLWFDNGRYDVNRYKNGAWVNAQESLNFWHTNVKKIQDAYNRFDFLNTAHADQVNRTTVTNPDGTTTTSPTIMNLKNVFNSAFVESYGYYMHHNFRLKFHEFLKFGAIAGELTGVQIGKRLAFENGYAAAYNEKFQSEAQRTYGQAYSNSYMSTFDNVYNSFMNTAKLNITKVVAIGEEDDGIFSKGERIKFKITVENRGGKDAANLKVNVSGTIAGSGSQALGTLEYLSADTFETDYIAQILPGQDANQGVALVVALSGSNGASARYDSRIDIRNQIETQGQASMASVETVKGEAIVSLPIKNISTVVAKQISAGVVIDGVEVATAIIGDMAAGQSVDARVRVTGLNAIRVLEGIRAEIVIKSNNTVIQGTEGVAEIKSRNITKDVASIFSTVAKGQRASGVNLDDAAAKVLQLDSMQTQANRKGENVYKKMADTTIPGQLVLQKGTSTDSSTLEAFNSLAVKMYVNNAKNLPSFLSGKRSAYRKLLDQLTISGSVKKASKGK